MGVVVGGLHGREKLESHLWLGIYIDMRMQRGALCQHLRSGRKSRHVMCFFFVGVRKSELSKRGAAETGSGTYPRTSLRTAEHG